HVLEDGEQPEGLRELEGAHGAELGDPECGDAGERATVEGPLALVRLVEAGEEVEERRLAGAIRADERGDGVAGDLDVVDVDRGEAAELPPHTVGDEDRIDLRDARAD